MSDIEGKRQIGRRLFLIGTPLSLAGLALDGCMPKATLTRPTIPTITVEQQIIALVQDQKQKWIKDLEIQKFKQISRFKSKTGVNITVFSQGPLDVDPLEFDNAMNAGFAIVQNFKEEAPQMDFSKSPFTAALLKANERMQKGDFNGREALVVVSADPETCIDQYGHIIPIPKAKNYTNRCSTGSRTVSALIGPTDQTHSTDNLPEARLFQVTLTATAVDNLTSYIVSQDIKAFTDPQTALGLAMSFEGMRMYLRMLGGKASTSEEDTYLNDLKKLLITTYALHPDIAFQPFTPPKPEKFQ